VPFSIEVIPPERTFEIVCHMLPFAVYAFEYIRAWSTLCCFKSWWIKLGVGLAALCHVPMVPKFVGSVTLLVSKSMSSIGESQITLFPAIVTLEDAQCYARYPFRQ